jgi:hypothetical protein
MLSTTHNERSTGTIVAFCSSPSDRFTMTYTKVFGPGSANASGAVTVEA